MNQLNRNITDMIHLGCCWSLSFKPLIEHSVYDIYPLELQYELEVRYKTPLPRNIWMVGHCSRL